jgi:hypothetical protein
MTLVAERSDHMDVRPSVHPCTVIFFKTIDPHIPSDGRPMATGHTLPRR